MSILPYEVRYVNSHGSVINLDCAPYIMVDSTLFDSEWTLITAKRPLGEGERLLYGRRQCCGKQMTVLVTADNATALSAALAEMTQLFEFDVVNSVAGRLWINDRYMSCWCTSSVKKLSCDFVSTATVTLTVYPERPVWCTEKLYRFTDGSSEPVEGHQYPYSYPRRYDAGRQSLIINNGHFAPSPMRIIFYGAADCPYVYVGQSRIGINTLLQAGEYAVIDQSTREIYKVGVDGTRTNCFNLRIKNGQTFDFAPAGSSVVQCGSDSGIDITLIEQRSEPRWTCG